eukprot:2493277-Amphidinium_carterae.1
MDQIYVPKAEHMTFIEKYISITLSVFSVHFIHLTGRCFHTCCDLEFQYTTYKLYRAKVTLKSRRIWLCSGSASVFPFSQGARCRGFATYDGNSNTVSRMTSQCLRSTRVPQHVSGLPGLSTTTICCARLPLSALLIPLTTE